MAQHPLETAALPAGRHKGAALAAPTRELPYNAHSKKKKKAPPPPVKLLALTFPYHQSVRPYGPLHTTTATQQVRRAEGSAALEMPHRLPPPPPTARASVQAALADSLNGCGLLGSLRQGYAPKVPARGGHHSRTSAGKEPGSEKQRQHQKRPTGAAPKPTGTAKNRCSHELQAKTLVDVHRPRKNPLRMDLGGRRRRSARRGS